jgi:hypothetical protein
MLSEIEAWWVPFVGTVATALGGAGIYLLKRLIDLLIKKLNANDAEKEALQCLLEGISVAHDNIVRNAKKAAADGKLSVKEIREARNTALGHAKEVATGPAFDVLTTWSTERINSLIRQLIVRSTRKER